jgi:antirestriction protein ArdC
MVKINYFTTPIEYYHTLAHEIIHSTGHASRLDRLVKFAKKNEYAFEELVADTAASYLLQHFGQATDSTLQNSASYVTNWLEALGKNPYFFYQAAKQAELATNYVLKEAL